MGSESIAAEWTIDSEAMRARGIYCFSNNSTSWSKISRIKIFSLVKARLKSFFAAKKPALFATSRL